MKVYEWIIALLLIGMGIMSMAVCGSMYKMAQVGYWISFIKTLLWVSIWIGIPIFLFYIVRFFVKKIKKANR